MGDRPPALSRSDDETLICERCGVAEALSDLAGLPRVPLGAWPVGVDAGEPRSRGSFDRVAAEYRRAIRRVGERFTSPDEDWAPVLFVEGRDGRTVVGLSPEFLENDQSKDALAALVLPAIVRHAEATMAGLVFSAWTVAAHPDEELVAPPSEDPRREEAVVLTIVDALRAEAWVAPIRRDPRQPPRLGRWRRMHRAEGRFVDPLRAALRDRRSVEPMPPLACGEG